MQNFRPSFEIAPGGEKIPVIPLVLPESFAEMAYAYTMMNGLPPVTKKNMIGLRLNLNIGQSTMNNSRDQGDGLLYVGIVCGFVPQNLVSVAGAPLTWVRDMHLQDHQSRAANSYDKIYIQVKNINNVNKIVERLTKSGLTVISGDDNTYNKINKWLNRLDILLWSFVAILLLISAISLSNSFMILTTQKRYEFGLYLVFGASPLFLWMLIFVEGAFWGAFHSSLAYFIAKNFSHFLQQSMQVIPWASKVYQGNITFDFTITFAEKWYLITGSILFAGISSLLPAVIMTGRKTLELVKKD
jgi:ABC-type antimicrobial peptide transport system permease subunit